MVLEAVRVFIGSEPKTEIARAVLECSIQRHTDARVEFIPMIGPAWEYDIAGIPVGTGFSLRRWMIPAYCNWSGRAIYLDADQLVFGDILDLWRKPHTLPPLREGRNVSAWMTYQPDKFYKVPAPQSSVMVIDCEKAKAQWGWYLGQVLAHLRKNPTKQAYAAFMHCNWMEPMPRQIEDGWNHLNVHTPKTKLLHYTKEPEQPWYVPSHPLAPLWRQEFQLAVNQGRISEEMIRDAVAKFNVKEDWRSTNGLHPDYLIYCPKAKPQKKAG